ncbi:MAG TPA: polyphosphate polymerase domain-containing protein [Verrucomicrobiota bacterium]|nr:polyphosphate polymerase domain-containing protein [Verrucomicrobiota bacterium]HNU51574.1 polyphosphate polymerase domain-containing protein [Verrucomicrobiota bacterium]
MTASLPNVRYERKFLVPAGCLAEAVMLVHRHPALFREVYPPRWVNNVYLDSPGLQGYLDHIHGVARRVKTRVRWYGAATGRIEKPALERKIKRGLVSGKFSYGLPALAVDGGLARDLFEAALNHAVLPERVRWGLRQLEPVLINRYRRRYYASADGRFRLTLDTDLEFLSPEDTAAWRVPPARTPSPVILELKYAPEDAEVAAEVTHALRLRVVRCSKYVLGIERVRVVPSLS